MAGENWRCSKQQQNTLGVHAPSKNSLNMLPLGENMKRSASRACPSRCEPPAVCCTCAGVPQTDGKLPPRNDACSNL